MIYAWQLLAAALRAGRIVTELAVAVVVDIATQGMVGHDRAAPGPGGPGKRVCIRAATGGAIIYNPAAWSHAR